MEISSDVTRHLKNTRINEKKQKQFEKKGLRTIEDLLYFFPRKYLDYRTETPIQEGSVCFRMHVSNIKSGISKKGLFYIIATGMGYSSLRSEDGRQYQDIKPVSVMWFECRYKEPQIKMTLNQEVLVAGKMKYDPEWDHYQVSSPDLFSMDITSAKKIYPVYSKITGMSDEYLKSAVDWALKEHLEMVSSDLPGNIARSLSLISRRDAVLLKHHPRTPEDLEKADLRLLCDDLYTFAFSMNLEERNKKEKSAFRMQNNRLFTNLIEHLPYHLTEDQEKAVYTMAEDMRTGKRVHALVQGDVGCGKTIVSFLMIALALDNGFQSVLLAPTAVLAQQHFQDLKKMMEPYGIPVDYMPSISTLKKKEKECLLKRIRSGDCRILVGTHSLLNDHITYHNLALIIADEEHKFGVEQREHLLNKCSEGVHYITMSATPIPRSLASVIYGNSTQLHLIQSMPSGRMPVRTRIYNNWNGCFRFMKLQMDAGRQIYIVCPQVDSNEKRPDVKSVSELAEIYGNVFGQEKIRTLTGKNSKKEVKEILSEFQSGAVPILIATTVIEVGVNVPNANTIIIHNAENFGLASLHQLRGRVGRGGGEAYCILFSDDLQNPRLKVMEQTNNGFEIAEEDLKLRGAGDLIGDQQSGREYYTSLAVQHSELYKTIRKLLEEDFRKTLF